MISDFFEEKRRVDPDQIFTNQWYSRYGHIGTAGLLQNK